MIDLLWIIVLPVIIGALAMLLPLHIYKKIALSLQMMMLAMGIVIFEDVKNNGTIIQNIGGWIPYIGITLRADPLAIVMVILTTLLFLAMFIYNLGNNYDDNIFLFLFTTLEGLIIGIFLSNDLFNIFVLLEVSTLIISILIMYKKDSPSIYDGINYLLISIVGMSFFLFGIGMLYKSIGVIDLYGINISLLNIREPDTIILPYAFIITGISLKSALMPLFSWLPKAHGSPSAPYIISAILSCLYVKNGVYLFIRVQDAFSPLIHTYNYFLVMSFITAVIGFVLAIAQRDIKLVLAYHTVSQIGLIMMGINMGSPHTYWGGVYHIINHAVFKSVLFLTAGMIIDEYGSRDVYKIKGVSKRMPVVAIASLLAIFGIIGAPLFNGSISKYLISYGTDNSWLEYALVLVNLGTIVSFIKYSQIFFGNNGTNQKSNNHYKNAIVLILGIMCFIGGIYGREFIVFLFGIDIQINTVSYINKALIFLFSLFIGFIIYYFLIKGKSYLQRINSFELTFNGVCLMILAFFTMTLTYLKLTH